MSDRASKNASRRFFLAFWPDEELRAQIVRRRQLVGARGWRQVPDHNLHMTLVFLGSQPAERLAKIVAAVDGVLCPVGEIGLDRFGWFPGAQVLWLGGDAGQQLLALHARVCQALVGAGLTLDSRPFRPHVTLYRRVSDRPYLPQPEPLFWRPRKLVLVQSVSGQPYRVVESWPLRG